MIETIDVHVLRHAHSSHATAGERDHLRQLDDRGSREVERIRQRLHRAPLVLDRIVCSTARRARQTLEPLLSSFPGVPVLFDDALYALGADAYERVVQQAGDATSLLLIGHNPTIELLVRNWCPGENRLAAGIGTAFWLTVRLRRTADGSLADGRLVALHAPT